MSPIEFRADDDSPIEVSETHKELSATNRKRFIVDGGRAFEVWHGKQRGLLLARYLARQKTKPPEVIVPETKVAPAVTEIVTPSIVVDEQAETEQFLEEITERELYVPTANEWFEARIVKGSNPKILILELTTGDRVTCIPVFVTESPGSHVLCLPIGTVGSVRIELYDGHYRALEFRVESEPSSLDETAQVFSWNTARNIGKAVRKCGCRIFIAYILDESIYGTIYNGDWIRYKLERSKSRTGWVGVSAQKINAPPAQERKDVQTK